LAICILVLVGSVLVLIALLSWFLARHSKQQRDKLKKKIPIINSVEKPLISSIEEATPSIKTNGIIPSSSSIEQINKPLVTVHISHSPIIEKKPLISPVIRQTHFQGTLTRGSSTATDDDDDGDGFNSFLRQYQTLPPVPTTIDEEYEDRFSLRMNKSEELGLGCLANGINNNDLILSHGYATYYQPDNQTGLIKPLHIRTDAPTRYTKYVSSCSKFVLPRPVKSSSEYQQR
jgi:hypothetical protein